MPQDTKRPATTPRMPFDELPYRQRRVWAYIRANGPRKPGAIQACLDNLFDSARDAEADMEAMIEAGWLRTVGYTNGVAEWGYDVPEVDREGYVRPFIREVHARLREPEDEWEDRVRDGDRMGRG